nr:immunoglobulin heavy chain junction region [Mus musculus]
CARSPAYDGYSWFAYW